MKILKLTVCVLVVSKFIDHFYIHFIINKQNNNIKHTKLKSKFKSFN